MQILLILALIIVAILFGLSSMSQSYATAQLAQAAIEASRAAQISSAGELVGIITVGLVIISILAALVAVAWFLHQWSLRNQKRQWISGPNANWGQVPQQQANDMLPTLMTMMLYQMMQNQKQQDIKPMLMDEPANDLLETHDDFWTM